MTRAVWRKRADDPKGLLGWWWRRLVEGSCGYLAFYCGLFGAGFALIVWHLTWPVFGLGLYGFALGFYGRRVRPDRLAALLPEPALSEQFRVSVTYRRDGLRTGADTMAFTVVDGWLIAEGLRSHFAVRSEDVRVLKMRPARNGWSHAGWIVLNDGTEVRFVGLDSRATTTLSQWRRDPTAIKAEPTLPPAGVHPQEFARAIASVAIGGVAGAAFFVLIAFMGSASFLPIVIVLFGILAVLVGSGTAVDRLRRLRRLDAHTQREALSSTPPLQNASGRTLEERPG